MKKTTSILKKTVVLYGVIALTQGTFGASKSWTGSGTDDLWSTSLNWTAGGPVTGDDVQFTFLDGMAINNTVTNNIVDASFTGIIRSLWFAQTNCLHRMDIAAPGLKVQGNAARPFFVGSGADDGATAKNYTTITGKSVEIDDPSGDVIVRQGSATSGAHYTVLNMSGLDTFTANVNRLLIAYEDDSQNPNRRPGAWVFMAKTNYITCNYPGLGYQIAHVVQQGGQAATNRLGQFNVFNVRSMRFGGAKTTSTMVNFNTGYTDPIALFRGIDGVSRQSAWHIADCATSGSSANSTATVDFNAGILDAMVDTVYLGRGQTGNNQYYAGGNGTLSLSRGLLDVNNFEIAYQVAAGSSAARGLLNVNGTATVNVNNDLRLARNLGPVAGSTLITNGVAFLVANGGTVNVRGNIVDGGGISTMIITNGGTVNLQPEGDTTQGNVGVTSLRLGQGTLTGFANLSVSNITLLAPATDFALTNGQGLYPLGKAGIGKLSVAGNLSLSAVNLFYELADPVKGSDQIEVTGNLDLTGVNSVDITPGAIFTAGDYTLMSYSGTLVGNAGNLQAGGAIGGSRYTIGFNTATPGEVKLSVTGGPTLALTWSGGNSGNTWDLKTTANWNVGTDKFYNLDNVTFNDSGNAASPVNLVGTLMPASVNFNDTKSYTLAGSGKISGPAALNYSSSGKLQVLTTNDFTGYVVINTGMIEVGDGTSADGSLGTGDVWNFSGVSFNPAGHQIIRGAIAGGGTIAKKGPGITELAGANMFTVALTNEAGTIKAGSATAFGDALEGTTINTGTTLDLGGNSIDEPVVVSGDGVGGLGAIINSGPLAGGISGRVIFTAPTTLGGSASLSINPATDGLQINSNKLTKVGANSVSFARAATGVAESGMGELDIVSGTVSIQGYVNVGDPSKAITIRSNATLEVANTGDTLSPKPILMHDGARISSRIPNISLPQYCALGGTTTLSGKSTFEMISGGHVIMNAEIAGVGSLVKTGTGKLTLNASNSFTGDLLVENGTVVLTNDASVAKAARIVLSSGTLDVTNRVDRCLTLSDGQVLVGYGTIEGNFSSPAGTSVLPGGSIGTLLVNGAVTLRGTTTMEISKFSLITSEDHITGSSIDLGGTLNITFAGDPLSTGDTFVLFNAPVLANSFATVNLPVIDGVVWTNKLNVDGSIEVVSAVSEPAEPPALAVSVSSDSLTLSWPTTYTSYVLQGQTNSLSVGLNFNWAPVPGVVNNSLTIPVVTANQSTFYRLIKQ